MSIAVGVIAIAIAGLTVILSELLLITQDRRTASERAFQRGIPGRTNENAAHESDAMQHCLASCEITRRRGEFIAECAGDFNEWVNPQDSPADQANNAVGRGVGTETNTDCIIGCVDALNSGGLNTTNN